MKSIDRSTLERRADAIFAAFADKPGPGCAVGIAHAGETPAKGYELASLEHGVPIDADTAFRIASVSKQFTVLAALMLAAEGRLSLDDEVRRHIPELPSLAATLTLDHLAAATRAAGRAGARTAAATRRSDHAHRRIRLALRARRIRR